MKKELIFEEVFSTFQDCLIVYNHECFYKSVALWHEQMLKGNRTFSNFKSLIRQIVFIVLSDLANDMRESYLNGNDVRAFFLGKRIHKVSSLL